MTACPPRTNSCCPGEIIAHPRASPRTPFSPPQRPRSSSSPRGIVPAGIPGPRSRGGAGPSPDPRPVPQRTPELIRQGRGLGGPGRVLSAPLRAPAPAKGYRRHIAEVRGDEALALLGGGGDAVPDHLVRRRPGDSF